MQKGYAVNPKCPERIDDIMDWMTVVVLIWVVCLAAAVCCGTWQGHMEDKAENQIYHIY